MGELFNLILIDPVINFLIAFSHLFGGSFGLAIIFVTLVVNIILLPLTIKQTRSMKKMQQLQPKIQEMQKKYAKDKQKQQQELLKLYREEGINPIGCALPLFIQMPIWIALYQAIIQTLPTTPEHLVGLSKHMYDMSLVREGIPPDGTFLGLDLAVPNIFLVLLIMLTMWLSQKMSATKSSDPKQQQTQQMMQWMMPLMFGFIFISFPSGLALYIIVANIFRMVVQRFIMGNWGGLETLFKRNVPATAPAGQGPTISSVKENKGTNNTESTSQKSETSSEKGKGTKDGSSRNKRKNRRRSR